jgi:hypothetical protein
MNETPDPLEELLRPHSPSASSPAWKETLLVRTRRTLRWRRRARWLGFAAALAACYVAGVLTLRLFRAAPVVEVETVYVDSEPGLQLPPVPETLRMPERAVTALALEWQAVEDPERSVELYRRAGDRYIDEDNDLESALRCYKRFLTECSEKELEITTQDNWLLVTLKNARLEEKRHAKNSG